MRLALTAIAASLAVLAACATAPEAADTAPARVSTAPNQPPAAYYPSAAAVSDGRLPARCNKPAKHVTPFICDGRALCTNPPARHSASPSNTYA